MPVENWYALQALRFMILFGVALGAIKIFAVLAALSGTQTIFDQPLRIAILAALGVGWPTFAPSHFDWLRALTFERRVLGSLYSAAVIWAPFLLGALTASAFGFSFYTMVLNDIAMTWAIAGLLALSDREHPGDRRRLRRDADEALRRLVASYEAIYGPAGVPVPTRSWRA